MALTQGARGKIKSFVQDAKRLLTGEFEGQLQQHYGIRMDGSCLMVEELTTKDASIIQTARLLRERLSYLEDTIAGNDKKREAVQQLVREQAFTILNRFAALRMAEERNIIRETIRKAYKSEGFEVFDQLTGGAKTAEQFIRYTWYINAVFDELANDLPSVFDRYSPFALLYPSERTFHLLLSIINQEELQIFREEGQQPINLWKDDETIGWIYQYYNSREEISAMREASGAPRNSRELAVRNQFFTPRYVVQFLVDNSLGRQWYEMTKGNTILKSFCQYMVKRSVEVFLHKGELPPINKEENSHYIEYRAIKDPREILMLDPACGSMHFGLYSFDLYEQIYLEAWDNYPTLMQDLRDQYLRKDFIKQIPGMILRYNLHGVDIDPRAIQIAGLSLWLRAQKSYDNLGLQPAERPSINKSNLVVAEPMPGNAQMLSNFTKTLPGPIGKLVKVIWDKMKLAGETGLLLKIEEELKKEIEIAKKEWEEYKNNSTQTTLFDSPEVNKTAHLTAIYGKEQKITKDFFDTAEEQVLKALEKFAKNADGTNSFQKLLFAEDTVRGFAFIELCRKRYDVILQNPPFGSASQNSKEYIDNYYALSKYDLASTFIDRMFDLKNSKGYIGSITTRTLYFLQSFMDWRTKLVLPNLVLFLDLGSGVLDAMVETSISIINQSNNKNETIFYRLTKKSNKESYLKQILSKNNKDVFFINPTSFKHVSNNPLCYWVDNKTIELFKKTPKFKNPKRGAFAGLATTDNERYTRNIWEVNFHDISSDSDLKKWNLFIISGNSNRFLSDFNQLVNWDKNGFEIKATIIGKGLSITKRVVGESIYFHPGISWAYRTSRFAPHIIPKKYVLSSSRYLAIDENSDLLLQACALWNSHYYDYIIKLSMEMESGNPKFINGTVNQLPYPNIEIEFSEKLISISKNQIKIVEQFYSVEETSIWFNASQFFSEHTLTSGLERLLKTNFENDQEYINNLKILNDSVFEHFNISSEEQISIINSVTKQSTPTESILNKSLHESYIIKVLSIIFGIIFKRWDLRIIKSWNPQWIEDDIFKARKHSPFLYGAMESTLNLVLPEFRDKVGEIYLRSYPIDVFDEYATLSNNFSLISKLEEVIHYFWPESSDTIIYEIQEHFMVDKFEEIFINPNKFFDAHLKDYSRNKRLSPIYWQLGIPSGKFTIWIYYPKLNPNSLYKIVNELVDPKIKEVVDEVNVLEKNGSSKDFIDTKQLRDELEDFKKELLRVAQLPYVPNHDDGVLITAAPLHNLFRHTKWRKSTEDCWNSLEKGEYDWSHMAYNIWPERVRKKCKKDLSMAIAHGLEDICEVKPKEKTEKKKPEIKVEQQKKLI